MTSISHDVLIVGGGRPARALGSSSVEGYERTWTPTVHFVLGSPPKWQEALQLTWQAHIY